MVEECFLGILRLVGAFAMLWSMAKITKGFGWHTWNGRWAWIRRILYGMAAIALFALATNQFGTKDQATSNYCEIALTIYILIFPILRATERLSQDELRVDGH